MASSRRRPFDLATQAAAARRAAHASPGTRHVLLLSIHHIVIDGWSMGVVLRELAALYQGERRAPPLALQYADYAAWQRDARNAGALRSQLDYWREHLAGLPPAARAARRPAARRAAGAARGNRALHARAGVAPKRCAGVAREMGATRFMVLLAAFDVLLARASGQRDIAVGTPIANRTRPELQPLVGFFANTVVVRVDLEGEPSFAEVVRRVREAALGAYAHQDVPFEQVVEALQPERSLAHTPLFQVLFVCRTGRSRRCACRASPSARSSSRRPTAKFDLTLAIEERDGALAGAIEYNTDLFDRRHHPRMAAQLRHAARRRPRRIPRRRRAACRCSRPASGGELVAGPARNAPAAGREDNALRCVAAQVARTPAAVAIEDGADGLTYAELDARANRLAHHLRARGAARRCRWGCASRARPTCSWRCSPSLKSGAAVRAAGSRVSRRAPRRDAWRCGGTPGGATRRATSARAPSTSIATARPSKRGRATVARGARRARRSALHPVHVGIHGRAQGRGGAAPRHRQPGRVGHARARVRGAGAHAAVHAGELRRGVPGDLRDLGLRRHAGGDRRRPPPRFVRACSASCARRASGGCSCRSSRCRASRRRPRRCATRTCPASSRR